MIIDEVWAIIERERELADDRYWRSAAGRKEAARQKGDEFALIDKLGGYDGMSIGKPHHFNPWDWSSVFCRTRWRREGW